MTPRDNSDFGSRFRDRKDETYALETAGAKRESMRAAAKRDVRLFEQMSGGIGPDGYSTSRGRRLASAKLAIMLGVVGLLVLVGMLAYLGSTLGGKTPEPTTQPTEKPDLNTLPPRQFAIQFLETEQVADKAAMCRFPNEAAEWIASFYGEGQSTRDTYFDVRGMGIKRQGDLHAYHFHVLLDDGGSRLLSVVSRGDGSFAVDFACFTRHCSMPWTKFLEQVSPDARKGTFRVYLRPGNYFNFDFADRKADVCFTIDSPDLERQLFGYAKRGSSLARTIQSTFGEERGARLTVELATTPAQIKNRQVEIRKLVSASWIVAD